jgi:uncharacterized Ntn-hydrolase superfamily protein
MTYSIVAYDAKHQQLGVAVQSHSLGCGASVSWAEAGVGVVATQARSDLAYSYLGLVMVRTGKPADRVLKALLASDPQADIRQVAMVDAQGNVAVHTGTKCIEAAGHYQGVHYCVQANLMLRNTVWTAMAQAFETTDGDLAQRMMAALVAAEAEGGDMRGQQSAALRVVSAELSNSPWGGQIFDLRVDDHPEPLKELQRLLTIARSFQHRRKAVDLLLDQSLDDQKFDLADQEFDKAMQMLAMAGDNPEVMFWYAVTLVSASRVEAALPLFKEVFTKDSRWRDLISRLVQAEFLPNDAQVIDTILMLR